MLTGRQSRADNDLNNHSRPGMATNTHSCDNIREVPEELRSATQMYPDGLGEFYQKYTEAYGIPVLGRYGYYALPGKPTRY